MRDTSLSLKGLEILQLSRIFIGSLLRPNSQVDRIEAELV